MGRDPIIKKAILKALETVKEGLSFTELSSKVTEILGRTVHDSALNSAIKSLRIDKSIEKIFVHNKMKYVLSRKPHKQTLKDFLINLTQSINLEELTANFALDKARLPSIVSMLPMPLDEYETCDKSNRKLSVSVDWSNPSRAISSVISNDYLILPSNTQDGIANLIFWSYWINLRSKTISHTIEDITLPSQIKNLQRCRTYAKNILKSAKERNDNRRARVEQAIIDIIDVTLELLQQQNLYDFIKYAHQKAGFVRSCENTILAIQGHFMASGERIFHNVFFEKSDVVFDGLNTIEDNIDKKCEMLSVFKRKTLSLDKEVWNDFIDFLFELYNEDFLKNFTGSYDEAIIKGKRYAKYSNDLICLFEKRQIVATYLWNIPMNIETEKYFKLPEFEEWYKALKLGNLSHRVWLFEDETIRDVERAYRRVRRNSAPEPWRIDKEPWTLKDLFDLHPKGKDPEFWHMLVNTLKAQKGKDPYRGGPVPKDIYYEFLKRERKVIKDLIENEKTRKKK